MNAKTKLEDGAVMLKLEAILRWYQLFVDLIIEIALPVTLFHRPAHIQRGKCSSAQWGP